jgi:hypothetical protein
MIRMTRCYVYWDKGYDAIPVMLKAIYDHNRVVCDLFNFPLVLISDADVESYIPLPKQFWDLEPNFRSDVIRFNVLNKYGGIWLDMDAIIIKNLHELWNSFLETGKEVMVDVEVIPLHEVRPGCASLVMQPNTKCSRFCKNYIDMLLNAYPPDQKLKWDFLGPTNIKLLYKTFPGRIEVNHRQQIMDGSNFVTFWGEPGINTQDWYMSTSDKAAKKSQTVFSNKNCYFTMTWTIYRINKLSDEYSDIKEKVCDDSRSVFYHLMKTSRQKAQEGFRLSRQLKNTQPFL